jgi:hypothetical protein
MNKVFGYIIQIVGIFFATLGILSVVGSVLAHVGYSKHCSVWLTPDQLTRCTQENEQLMMWTATVIVGSIVVGAFGVALIRAGDRLRNRIRVEPEDQYAAVG